MIITEIFYGIKCDRCGELYEDGEHSFWNDESSVLENAYESEWRELKGKHYCEGCHEINEETDEVVVYPDYPQHLKTVNSFIDRIMKGLSRKVFEYESEFHVKFKLYKYSKLEESEENYIKSLLGEYLNSLEYEVGRYDSKSCIIKISK